MSKDLNEQAVNEVKISGRLSNVTFNDGKLSDGRVWESALVDILVREDIHGVEEESTIQAKIFATPLTTTGKPHPGWKTIQELKEMNTIQNVGYDQAQRINIRNGELIENSFVGRSGQVVSGYTVRTTFVNKSNMTDCARARLMTFIMDMHDEVDREGEETGRLVVKGGVVGYGGKLNVFEFIVEGADEVENARRTFNVNDTVILTVRFRVISKEETVINDEGGWGEKMVETTPRTVRELLIIGSTDPIDEDFAYSAADIKKAFNERKANIEQMQIEAKNRTISKASTAAPVKDEKKHSWGWE